MDGVAFQGMPRIALTPAEEAQIPRPHSSASQVATAVPSAYSRTTASPPSISSSSPSRHPHHRNHHNAITYHPYYANNASRPGSLAGLGAHLGSPSSASIPISDPYYSRPSSPGPRPSSPSVSFQHHTSSAPSPPAASNLNKSTTAATEEQEYPQNPQESYHHNYYSQVPSRSASPGPSRLAFALGPRPARSPSPQLHNNNNLYDHYQPRSSYFHRSSYDVHPRPGSPLQQEHQNSWDSNNGIRQRVESPNPGSESDDEGSDSGSDSDNPRRTHRHHHRPVTPQRSNSKSILSRLRETTSRLSLGDDSRRPSRASQDSNHRGDSVPQTTRNSLESSTSRPGEGGGGKEVLQDLSDEERGQEPRRSRSGWRPSLSLIRQESSIGSNTNNLYLQNNPNRISDMLPSNDDDVNSNSNNEDSNAPPKKSHRKKNSKSIKKKRRRQKKRRAEKLAALQKQQQQLYEQQLTEQALYLPELQQILDKKTTYPLSYDDFEAFLRSQRAVEYLNFWADVTAHERLCRTFDVSERRQKRELQLEERAIARDKRRVAMLAAMESERITPDSELLTPGLGAGTGVGVGASGQDIEGSNLYTASRSSLQLPLNDHLSFPQESRRYGVQDSSAPYNPHPPNSGYFQGVPIGGAHNRHLAGAGTERTSNELTGPSLEEAHISEQDAAVAAVAMRAQRNGQFPPGQTPEEVRRGSFDYYRPLSGGVIGGGGGASLRYLQNNHSNGFVGGPLTNSYSAPNAYNLLMRGRGSVDVMAMARSNSRNSRTRPAGTEDYFGNGIRRVTSQNFQTPQTPPQHIAPQQYQDEGGVSSAVTQHDKEVLQDEAADNDRQGHHVLRHQASQYSIAFTEPELHRHPSMARFGASGYGPLQASAMARRSGESAYAPSLYSMGQEGRAMLVQSFRTIGLEDVQESAMRIYRKYMIQLRTASMAAEEEAAAFAANESNGGRRDGLNRPSLEKSFAPGWDGYAEEVIAQWNEKWKGRSREARRSRRLTGGRRTYSGRSADADYSGQPSTVGDDESPELAAERTQGRALTINTHTTPSTPAHSHRSDERGDHSGGDDSSNDREDEDDDEDEEDDDFEEGTMSGRRDKSAPSSLRSPRTRKRTGTGLSALLNPFLTRLMRTETTVVELPTLTINTTTVEEAAVLDDTDDDDEEDDEEDEDSDDEAEDDDDEEDEDSDNNRRVDRGAKDKTQESHPEQLTTDKKPLSLPAPKQDVEEVVVEEVVDRSMPTIFAPQSPRTGSDRSRGGVSDSEAPIGIHDAPSAEPSELPIVAEPVSRKSSASSLSSSWDRITRQDLAKQVTILPPPVTASVRNTPYHRQGLRGVRSGTGKAAKSATRTAQKVGLQLSTFWNKSLRHDSSESSLDVLQVTPVTPRIDFQFQIPAIVMDSPSSNEKSGSKNELSSEKCGSGLGSNGGLSPASASGANSPIIPLQSAITAGPGSGQSSNVSELAAGVNEKSSTLYPPSQPFGSPGGLSTFSKPSTALASPQSSPGQTSTGAGPHFSGSSPAAVAASAAAAAFYLPLECRQRIHTQVQEEGRTEAPYLYGPAKGFVMDVVLQDHYYPLFLEYVEHQNLGLLTRKHPNNVLKRRVMVWSGIGLWLVTLGIQVMLVLIGEGGWRSPWVYLVGIVGGWTGSICLATGVKRFSPLLGIAGKMCEDKQFFRFRKIQEPSIRVRHRLRAYWMLTYCIFWSTIIMVIFAALPQRTSVG